MEAYQWLGLLNLPIVLLYQGNTLMSVYFLRVFERVAKILLLVTR